ncbi:MAG: thioredoxin family protein [Candidatus Anstonellaceae archaeon]
MHETSSTAELAKKISKGKWIVLFYASWCPDCAKFMPKFDSLPIPSGVSVLKAKIDEDSNPIWEDFKIEVVPTVVLFENGKEKARTEETFPGECAKGLKRLLSKC